MDFDPKPLHDAARAYAKAVIDYRSAFDEHQRDHRLDAFDSKRCKSENRLHYAERTLEHCLTLLKAASLVFAGADAADLGRKMLKAMKG